MELVPQIAAVGRALGSMAASLFLFHAISCQRRAGAGVWFDVRRDADRDATRKILSPPACEAASWEWSTGLHRREQQCARKILKASGLLDERRQGIPARLFFLINLSKAENLIAECALTHRRPAGNDLSVAETASHAPTRHPKERRQPGISKVSRKVQSGPTNNKRSFMYENTTTGSPKHIKLDDAATCKNVMRTNLEFHPAVEAHIPAIEQALRNLKDEDAQAVIDELTGNLLSAASGRRRPIQNVAGWLCRIATLSAEGAFVPNAGVEISRQRSAAKTKQTITQKDAVPVASMQTVAPSELSQQCIADLRQILGPRPAGRLSRQPRSRLANAPDCDTIQVENGAAPSIVGLSCEEQ
ncbi:hypothetical protein [Paraburkholderia domus]|uniref:hypothetical protein n=1 Tax=Paraburkholderia domus TaxID=2793075 RepID=UPI001912A386|nr:hypothetical protein [Paraburkholderia domus]MBK5184262.1 hypothetical protein [Burkholderia sp. R-69749]CAE6871487.1 hypothetical protein R69749_06241 [Paraburkholderia domus]